MKAFAILALLSFFFLPITSSIAQDSDPPVVETVSEPGLIEAVDQTAGRAITAMADTVEGIAISAKEVAIEMKPDLRAAIAELLEYLKAGGEFIGEQAPLLFEDIIRWGIYSRLPWLLVGCVFAFFGWRLRMWANTFDFRDMDSYRWSVVCWVGIFSISTLIFTMNLFYMLKPLVAPRLYLIETLADLAK